MERKFGRPKTQEHLQVQVEAFADKGVKGFSDEQRKLLKYSSELAKIDDFDNLPEDLPEELVELINKNKEKYIEFLRREKKEEIEFKKENIELYKEKFQPVIHALKERVRKVGDSKKLPEYLGAGSNGLAYRIEVDGNEYAAKSGTVTQANFEIKALLRAKGVPHASQLVAYSFEDRVTIMELLPGTDVTNFTPENALEYSDEDITQLINTVIDLDKKGVMIDPKPSNFLYDEKEGFSVLDFHLKGSSKYTLADSIMDLKVALTARKFPHIDWRADDYKEKSKQQTLERNKIGLPIMVRFLSVLREEFPEILEEWRDGYDKREKDPRISQSPPVDREYIQVNHPDLAPHLKKLEKMGF